MREWLFLECTQCNTRYYRTSKNPKLQAKIELKKFCPRCKRHTIHRERKK
jgi:large subunit ribosomal protein L33